jgi:DNA polymerase III delta prime subunit
MSKNKTLIKDFSYPETNDPDIQAKLFRKREFYYHQIKPREKMESYEDIKKYRDQVCKSEFKLREQQAILSNLFSPNTPYKGLLIMHGTGTGKSCTAISIAELFKEQVKKYNTKIYVLTFGPNGRETIKNELLFCTGETYIKNKEILNQMTKAEREREKKIAINAALQSYKILSYKTFLKKVLGEKINEKEISKDNKIVSKHRRNDEGELEREIVVDKITNMNNSILIVDEAHNLTGNDFGEALKKIIKESENLRVILLTATPMKNLADDIIDLLNFIRPTDNPIQRDKIFTAESNANMKIKPGGLDYLKEKASGYVSFFRGNIPFTFAKRVDKGIIPNGLLFTPLIRCSMEDFQKKYQIAVKVLDDKLDKKSSSAANFVFPGLNKEKNDIIGYHSNEGINIIMSQINTDGNKLKSLINKKLFNGKLNKEVEENFIIINEKKNLSGYILKKEYLRYFSIKFYKALRRLEKLFVDKSDKQIGTAFVYSNLVKAGGMEIFAEVLLMNGFLEYQEDYRNYDIQDNTIDYKTGLKFIDFKKKFNVEQFSPAVFILITGSSDEGGVDDIPEIKQKVVREVFNNENNIDGRYIKICLGSKVMNEGVTLENVKEVHILDVHYNLGKVEQVIGRGIRMCKHIKTINDNNKFPKVNVYRYVVSDYSKKNLTKKEKRMAPLTSDEILYQKAELKYLIVKEVEHALKEVAIDCPLLLNGNIFPEEIEKSKGCVYPTLENVKAGKHICSALCDFKECDYKCTSKKLNDKYFEKNTYKLDMKDLDYNTFNDDLAKFEIISIKNKIKDMYRFKHVYLYDEILNEIKKSFEDNQSKLFEDYFLDQAIEDMMPRNENDFNNYKDTIYDKYNRAGYLIQRDKFYIFQPFDENEEVNMFYRENIHFDQQNLVSIRNYVKQNFGDIKVKVIKEDKNKKEATGYNFEDVLDYYDDRDENFIVGIIDKNFNKLASSENDLFKIREPRAKNLVKKRGTGIPTFKGSVCSTSKSKEYLVALIKKIPNVDKSEITRIEKLIREDICIELKNKLLYLEKYSTSKNNNKITYIMIPADHPEYDFPYNLEDRVKDRINKINKIVGRNVDFNIKKLKDNEVYYQIIFKNEKFIERFVKNIEELRCKLNKNEWILELK